MPIANSLARAGDVLNPIVVKEVRQGLRARTFTVSFSLLLAFATVASLVAWSAYEPGRSDDGATMFGFCFAAYALVGFLVLPMSLFRGFVRERESETWPLVVMTGLGPRRVLRGKIASSLVQAALYASAISPFFFFSYFLQGISLAAILALMAAALVYQLLLTTLAASAATFGDTRFSRAFVSGVFGIGIVLTTIALVTNGAAYFVGPRLGIGRPDAWVFVIALFFVASFAAVAFETAAARLMAAGENHALGPRLTALVHLGGLGLFVHHFAPHDSDLAPLFLGYGTVFAYAFGLFAATEADGATRGVRARMRLGMLLPGAKRGLVFGLLLEALVVAIYFATAKPTHELDVVLAVPVAFVSYLALPIAIGRGIVPEQLGQPARVRLLALALVIAGMLGVPSFFGWTSQPVVGLANPFFAGSRTPLVVGACGAGALLVVAFVVLRARERAAEKS